MTTSSRKKKSSPSTFIVTGLILAVTLITIYFIYAKLLPPSSPAISGDSQITQVQNEELKTPQETTSLPQHATESNTDNLSLAVEPQKKPILALTPCQEAGSNLFSFFTQLSTKEYIKAYELQAPLHQHINKIIIKLLNNPPIITSETDDLLNILKNGAHFYRVLGSKDISLIKDILAYESEYTENILNSIYNWSLYSDLCPDSPIRFNLSEKKLYEYSAFFLNTLGGQSYLFRRESRTRVLIKYYSTLVLSRAVNSGSNKYDINLNQSLDSTLEDLGEADYLVHKSRYIATLIKIKDSLR